MRRGTQDNSYEKRKGRSRRKEQGGKKRAREYGDGLVWVAKH